MSSIEELEKLVRQHQITIRSSQKKYTTPIEYSYTLSFQGRILAGEMYDIPTVTTALMLLFDLSIAGKSDRQFKDVGRRHERDLKQFLASSYRVFKSAFDKYECERAQSAQAHRQSMKEAIDKIDNQRFEPDEPVQYRSLNERDWIDATVVEEIWIPREYRYDVLLQHTDGSLITLNPGRIRKYHH